MKRVLIRKDVKGVSPVIAVILMVAITVVLSGVLYVWVTGLSVPPEKTEYILATLYQGDGNKSSGCLFTLTMNRGSIEIEDYYFSVGKEDASPKLWTWDGEGNKTSDHPDYGYTIDTGRGGSDAKYWAPPETIGFNNPVGSDNELEGIVPGDRIVVKIIYAGDNSEVFENKFTYLEK